MSGLYKDWLEFQTDAEPVRRAVARLRESMEGDFVGGTSPWLSRAHREAAALRLASRGFFPEGQWGSVFDRVPTYFWLGRDGEAA